MTSDLGTTLSEDILTTSVRHICRLVGRTKFKRGTWVSICKVFMRAHMRFIEAPRTTPSTAFTITPVVRELSTKANAFSTIFIRVLFDFCGGIRETSVRFTG